MNSITSYQSTRQPGMPGKRLCRHSFFLRSGSASGVAGMAIILVTMIVSLASLVVINGTYSTFLSGRSVGMVERQLQAEFILKSLVNVAAELIIADQSPNVDSQEDIWGIFMQGAPVPAEMLTQLGFYDPGMQVSLEITPENAKLRLDQVDLRNPSGAGGDQTARSWKERYASLFADLGFDADLAEPDHTGLFPNQVFDSRQLAENLETYQRTDMDDSGSRMPTGNGKIRRIGELVNIPGFTPARINALSPYVTLYGNSRINVNVALPRVLQALDPDLNPQLIIDYRDTHGSIERVEELREVLDPTVFSNLLGRISTESNWFQIIGKVEYGGGISYFARAVVNASGGTQARVQIESLQLY